MPEGVAVALGDEVGVVVGVVEGLLEGDEEGEPVGVLVGEEEGLRAELSICKYAITTSFFF